MRETFGWLFFLVFGGLIIYAVVKKPKSTGAPANATIRPSANVAPTTNNVSGTVAGAAKAATSISGLINSFISGSPSDGGSLTQDATVASIAGSSGGNIGDFPGIVDTNPLTPISSIYDVGLGVSPTLAQTDLSQPFVVDANPPADISLYA